jgi:hypothetical protein
LVLNKDEIAKYWSKLNTKELLYASSNAAWIIKSRKMGWEEHCMHG